MHPDQEAIERQIRDIAADEKHILGLLEDRGAGSARIGPAMTKALLNLKDSNKS